MSSRVHLQRAASTLANKAPGAPRRRCHGAFLQMAEWQEPSTSGQAQNRGPGQVMQQCSHDHWQRGQLSSRFHGPLTPILRLLSALLVHFCVRQNGGLVLDGSMGLPQSRRDSCERDDVTPSPCGQALDVEKTRPLKHNCCFTIMASAYGGAATALEPTQPSR